MMLAPVLLKLALQVMLEMEDLRLHQGVGDVADRVLLHHQASFSCNFICIFKLVCYRTILFLMA
jgi:hypothetical protein